jgi:outer membrane autotransporter protein
MQRIEVNQGTLQVNNDYAMASDSTFQTNVNGDGSHGQLRVNGTTTLDGALKVIKGPGPYVDGTTYDILTGDAVNGWFTSETLPAPTPLVSFLVNPPRDHVEIEAQVNSFTTVTNNSTHNKIARYLDKILPAAKGDLAYVLGEIQLLSEPEEFNKAFSSLSPDSYDNYTRGTLFATQQYAKSLQYRMNNVRSHIRAGSPDNEQPTLLAYNGSDASLGQLFTPGQLSQIQGKNGLWLDAFGQWGDQDEEDGFTGYDYFMRGATLGFDHRLMDKLMAGLSLGYSRSDIDLDRDQGDGDVKSFFGSLYGSYFDKNLYIDAILSYGRNWYDNSRMITIGGILREATSDHDAHLFSGYLGGGYYFDFNPWAFGPYGSLQYIRLDEESFEEEGAGAISLRVDDRQTDALVSELGLRMVRLFKGKCGNFIPEVSLGWSHDFDIDDHVVRASFAGSPGASFSIEGQDVERDGVVVGAGLTFIHKGGFSTSFRYKGDFRGDYKSNAVMGEIRFAF